MIFYHFTTKAYSAAILSGFFYLYQLKVLKQLLTEVNIFLDFGIFRLGLSNLLVGAWFPFDKGQSIQKSWLSHLIL